jgi:hypothetical protein
VHYNEGDESTSQILHEAGGLERGTSNCVPQVTQMARSEVGIIMVVVG